MPFMSPNQQCSEQWREQWNQARATKLGTEAYFDPGTCVYFGVKRSKVRVTACLPYGSQLSCCRQGHSQVLARLLCLHGSASWMSVVPLYVWLCIFAVGKMTIKYRPRCFLDVEIDSKPGKTKNVLICAVWHWHTHSL